MPKPILFLSSHGEAGLLFLPGTAPPVPSSELPTLTGTQVTCRCGLPLDDASASVLRLTVNSVAPFCTNSEPPESKDTPPSLYPSPPSCFPFLLPLIEDQVANIIVYT